MKLLDGDHHYIMSLFWFSSYKTGILSSHTAWKVSIPGVFLVRIFPHSEKAEYLSVFNPNGGKYGPEKLRIRILFHALSATNTSPPSLSINPPAIYFFKVSNGEARSMCEICRQLTINNQGCHSGVFHMFLMLTSIFSLWLLLYSLGNSWCHDNLSLFENRKRNSA